MCIVKVREYVIYWKRPANILILLLQTGYLNGEVIGL